jgi:3'(2'), 5'-bisphosphate nucleotidase
MNSISYYEYLPPCCTIARTAAELIMTYYNKGFDTRQKDDKSPVTDADVAANQLIVAALRKLAPHIPIIAEEDETLGEEGNELFWLVDPLDGTRAFVRGEPEFTVNIGLIHKNQPVLGVIVAPPQELLYAGVVGQKAFREDVHGKRTLLKTRKPAENGVVVVRSKSHPSPATEAYLKTLKIKELVPGSSSIKFCTIAEGNADIYPRFGRTMEWDTAAGHAILKAAGGRVETVDGKPLTYGKPGFENPHFIAYGY